MTKKLLLLTAILAIYITAFAQSANTKWDNTINKNWPASFKIVNIRSTADGSIQKARFYATQHNKPMPLIVSLHTWSGDYNQQDPLAKEVLLRGWNYIHPDFRGPNRRPQACGSKLVLSDIEDAIHYAIHHANVDTTEVHIIGVSGGGYATLLCFMKLNYPVKSFNAWASISNLVNWYWQCRGRGLKYAKDLEGVTTNGHGFDAADAVKRSPIFMNFDPGKRKGATLNIYEGIHDGYTGSVPITQSLKFFNHLAKQMYPQRKDELLSDSLMLSLVTREINPSPDTAMTIGSRKVYLYRKLPHLSLTIFEGTHEMLSNQALALTPVDGPVNRLKLKILTIGDSNGAFKFGWPDQLKKLLPYSTIINKSIAGNTIGFDNLNNSKLNTLKNLDGYLDAACARGKAPDYIFIGLGTNDAKRVFRNRQKEVSQNMNILLERIKRYFSSKDLKVPGICVLSAPPMDEQKITNKEKYGGGAGRVKRNNGLFERIAKKDHCDFLDTYDSLKKDFSQKTIDGIHLKPETQFQVAGMIVNYLNQKSTNMH